VCAAKLRARRAPENERRRELEEIAASVGEVASPLLLTLEDEHHDLVVVIVFGTLVTGRRHELPALGAALVE
jgi:hypothetical protein